MKSHQSRNLCNIAYRMTMYNALNIKTDKNYNFYQTNHIKTNNFKKNKKKKIS